ncbi:MAG: hypothetical protein ACI9K2_004071 [Myxococcota bacterium]|jgi:hypothetical protein
MLWMWLAGCVDPGVLSFRVDLQAADERWIACGGDGSIEPWWSGGVEEDLECIVIPGETFIAVTARQAEGAPLATWSWSVDGEPIDVGEPGWLFSGKDTPEAGGRQGSGVGDLVREGQAVFRRAELVEPPPRPGSMLTVSLRAGEVRSLPLSIPVRSPSLVVTPNDDRARQVGSGGETFIVQTDPPLSGVPVTVQSFAGDVPVGRPLALTLDSWGETRAAINVPWLPAPWTVHAETDLGLSAVSAPIDVAMRGPLQLAVYATRPDAITEQVIQNEPPLQRAVNERPGCVDLFLLAYHPDPPGDREWTLTTREGAILTPGRIQLNERGVDAESFVLTSGDIRFVAEHPEIAATTLERRLAPMRVADDSRVIGPEPLEVDIRGTPLATFGLDLVARSDLPVGVLSNVGAPDVAVVLRPLTTESDLPCGDPVPSSRVACDPADVDPTVDGDCWLTQELSGLTFGRNVVPLSPGVCWAGTVQVELWSRPWTEITDGCVGEWPVGPWTRIGSVEVAYSAPG